MSKQREPAWRKVLCRVNEDPNIHWAMKDDNNESFIPTEIFKCGDWYDMSVKTVADGMTFQRWATSFDV